MPDPFDIKHVLGFIEMHGSPVLFLWVLGAQSAIALMHLGRLQIVVVRFAVYEMTGPLLWSGAYVAVGYDFGGELKRSYCRCRLRSGWPGSAERFVPRSRFPR